MDSKNKLAELHREAEERDALGRSKHLDMGYVDMRKSAVSLDAIKLLPKVDAVSAESVPIQLRGREVALASTDPRSPEAKRIAALLEAEHYTIKWFVASKTSVSDAIRFYDFVPEKEGEIRAEIENLRTELGTSIVIGREDMKLSL